MEQLEMFTVEAMRGEPRDPSAEDCLGGHPHSLYGWSHSGHHGVACCACRGRWVQAEGRFWLSPVGEAA